MKTKKIRCLTAIGISLSLILSLKAQTVVNKTYEKTTGNKISFWYKDGGAKAFREVTNGVSNVTNVKDRELFYDAEITTTKFSDIQISGRRFYSEAGPTITTPRRTKANGTAETGGVNANSSILVNGLLVETQNVLNISENINVSDSLITFPSSADIENAQKGKKYLLAGTVVTTIFGVPPGTHKIRIRVLTGAGHTKIPEGYYITTLTLQEGILSSALEKISKDLEANKKSLTVLENSNTAQQNEITALKKRITTTETNIVNLTNNYKVLKNLVDQNVINIAELQKSAVDFKTQVTSIKNDINNIKSDISKNSKNISENLTKITKMEGDIVLIDGRVSKLEGDLTVINGRVTNIEGKIVDINGKIITANKLIDKNKSDIASMIKNLSAISAKVTVNDGKIVALDSRITQNSAKILENRQFTVKEITNLRDAVKSDNAALKKELDAAVANERKLSADEIKAIYQKYDTYNTNIEKRLITMASANTSNKKYTDDEIKKLYDFLGKENAKLKADLESVSDRSKLTDWLLGGGIIAGVALNDLVLNEYGDWAWGHNYSYVYPGTTDQLLNEPSNSSTSLRLSGYETNKTEE